MNNEWIHSCAGCFIFIHAFFFLSDGEDAVYNCIENYQYISQVRIRDSDPTPSFLTHQYKDLSMYIFLVGK